MQNIIQEWFLDMHITGFGVFILLVFIGLPIAYIFYKKWRAGGSVSIKPSNLKESIKSIIKKEKLDDSLVLCLNVYGDRIVAETMLKKSVCPDADIWEIGAKKYLLQGYVDGKWVKVELPGDIAYPPERLCRMMGCEPLRRLKSLKFKWYEQMAPFAPVAALLIGFLLYIVVK